MQCKHCGAEWSMAIRSNSLPKFCPVCGAAIKQEAPAHPVSLEETIHLIAHDYGISYLQDGVQAMAYFSDLAPNLRKEKIMLQHLIQCNGHTRLISVLKSPYEDQQRCIEMLVSSLMEDLFLSEAAAKSICIGFWNGIHGPETPRQPKLTPEELFQAALSVEEEDIGEAMQHYTKAAEAGHIEAQKKLASIYRQGTVAKKDPVKAFCWYEKAADAGSVSAQCNLGWCYANGFGVKKDPEKAVYWFSMAATAGELVAQCNLGKCYEVGNGIPQSFEKAKLWYEHAAKSGHPRAQYLLGRLFEYSPSPNGDLHLAFYWYKKAASNEHPDAQYALGTFYETGKCVDRDLDIAFYWFNKAASNGHALAKGKIAKQL